MTWILVHLGRRKKRRTITITSIVKVDVGTVFLGHGQYSVNASTTVYPGTCTGGIGHLEHMNEVKINHIEYLDGSVRGCTGEIGAIGACGHSHNHAQVRIVVFYKFDTRRLLFPKFDVTVN